MLNKQLLCEQLQKACQDFLTVDLLYFLIFFLLSKEVTGRLSVQSLHVFTAPCGFPLGIYVSSHSPKAYGLGQLATKLP